MGREGKNERGMDGAGAERERERDGGRKGEKERERERTGSDERCGWGMEHRACGAVSSSRVGLKVKARVSFPSSFPVKMNLF